jgi:NADP-dependent 3-hydroxy acid dehydrogenase YdfG
VAAQRTAIVTGGTAGIGLATAEAFGALGWRVAIGARRPERLEPALAVIAKAGGHGFGHVLDVTDPDSIDVFVSAAEKALGPADVLVNNAAGAHPGRLHELSVEDIRAAVESSLLGSLFTTRRVLQGMLAHGAGGDLVFVSSRAAAIPWPRHTPYGAAKAGVENAAASLRAELEGTGIRSTVVRVGDTVTEFGSSWTPDEFAHVGYWHGLGLVKGAVLEPAQVAAAVLSAVTAPRGCQLETIVVNPQLPKTAP